MFVMKICLLALISNICLGRHKPANPAYLQPQQIHLSFGSDETQMIVTWITFNETAQSQVRYGIDKLDNWVNGTVTLFVDGGNEKRSMLVHRVTMIKLTPGSKYKYHCGSIDGWSSLFVFSTLKPGVNWSPKFAIYGDLGNYMAISLSRLQDEAQQGIYNAIFHIGDFAYDLHNNNGRVGDEFFRQIEPIAGYVPYQVCPGNHERYYNFSNYDNRFSMVSQFSNQINNHYWSYNVGPAHFIFFSTEFYHYRRYNTTYLDQIRYQYEWLENDLINANKPENRAKHPWIVTLGHRPIYSAEGIDELLRLGDIKNEVQRQYGLEDLFYKYGVDIEFWAHQHNYERLWPIYNNTIYNGSLTDPYNNPKAPVHIISGSAGSYMKQYPVNTIPFYNAFMNNDYGYTVLTVFNSTHVNIKQISDDKNGELVDSFNVIKNLHGPQAWL